MLQLTKESRELAERNRAGIQPVPAIPARGLEGTGSGAGRGRGEWEQEEGRRQKAELALCDSALLWDREPVVGWGAGTWEGCDMAMWPLATAQPWGRP